MFKRFKYSPAGLLQVFIFFLCFLYVNTSMSHIELGAIKDLFTVDQIKVMGLRKVEVEAVIEKLTIKEGMTLDNYQLRRDIEGLYSLGHFDSIEAHQESEGGKNILVFKVQERPIISELEIKGEDGLDEDDIKGQMKVKAFNLLDPEKIQKDLEAIKKLYESKGFYLAQPTYKIETVDKENVKLIIDVEEYDKVKVKKITFIGNRNIPDDELKKFMETREDSLFSGISGAGSFKEESFQTDIQRLKYYYQTKGYIQANLGSPQITISEDKRWVFVSIPITEGPKFSVNEIFFEGDLLFDDSKLLDAMTLRAGEDYSEEKMRNDIQKLTEMYQDEGYAFANVLRTLEPVPGENRVDVRFNFEKGKIAYFGKITVKGNSTTRDKVIRRELKFFEGERYSGSKFRISKENVNRLGFFEPNSVIFNTTTPKDKDDVVEVEISIKERPTGQISLGAGYSTATKEFFQGSIKKSNFRGLGQELGLTLNYSKQEFNASVSFDEPYFMDTKWKLGGDAYYQKVERSGNEIEKVGSAARLGYPIADYTTLINTYRLEKTRLIETNDPYLKKEENKKIENGIASSWETAISYDRRNNIFEPTGGYYFLTGGEYVGLGGDHKLFKGEFEGQLFANPYGDFVFRSRLIASKLVRTTDRPIARTRKFTMGGAKTLRGFDYGSISPKLKIHDDRDNDGIIDLGEDVTVYTGGNFMLLSTAEIEHPLIREANLKWAIFFDAGNVFENYWGEKGINGERYWSLRSDWGVGFRWFTPIGILRFEFGFPIDRRSGEAASQFHFDLGKSF